MRNRKIVMVAGFCVLTGVFFAWVNWIALPEPAAVKTFEHGFTVTDRTGLELWHQEFPTRLELSTYNGPTRMWAVEDLNRDGSLEVLFIYNPPSGDSVLACYSSRGRELWRWRQERTLRTPMGSYAPPYRMTVLALEKLAQETRVLAVAQHHLYYPTRAVLLSPEGKVLGDYLHSGHLADAAFRDVDGDGGNELLLAGVSNAHKSATLVVLDPRAMTGSSDEGENSKYQILAPPAREKARLLLTPSKYSRSAAPFNFAMKIDVSGQNIFVTVMEEPPVGVGVIWEFAPDLKPIDIGASSWFTQQCEKMPGRSPADCESELVHMMAAMRDLRR